jgi:outer membrane receptor protein involved in Fe transport
MKRNRLRLLLGATLLMASHTPLMLAQSVTQPSDQSGPVVKLPQFTVSTARGDPYHAGDSLSSSRIRSDLLDTPATINVITSDFLKDIGANSMFDGAQYVSGIGNGRLAGVNGILDRVTIRGFESTGRNTDNFHSEYQANVDPDLIERIEIVKGPDTILAPTGSPGGTINAITKSPLMTQENSVSVQVGFFNAQRVTLDFTGPLSSAHGLAYRMIAAYQDTRAFMRGPIRQWDVNPELSYQISSNSKLTLKYSHIDWAAYGAASSPSNTWIADDTAVNGGYASNTPPAGFTYRDHGGIPNWAARIDRVDRIAAELTTALASNINMRLAACYWYEYFDQDAGSISINTGNNRYNPYTGIYTPDYTWALDSATGTYLPTYSAEYNPTDVPRTGARTNNWVQDMQVQNDFAGNFRAGPVSLEPVAGWAYEHNPSKSEGRQTPIAHVNLYAQDLNPPMPVFEHIFPGNLTGQTLNKEQVYAYLRTGFLSDRLFSTVGVSRVWLDSIVTNELNWTSSQLKGSKDTYLAGALAKLTKNVAVYASYTTNANATTYLKQPLWQTGKQYEFGMKSEFFDRRLSLSAAHFQTSITNLVTPNPFYVGGSTTQPQNFLSDQGNHGFEIDASGGITKNLSILASFTSMRLRDVFGRRVRNIPDRTANALLDYRFHDGALKGGSVFLGVTYVGDQAGENPSSSATVLGVIEQVSYYVHARTIWNAGGRYTVGRYAFNLNVDNLANTHSVWQSSGRNSLSGYPLINVRLTTTVKF